MDKSSKHLISYLSNLFMKMREKSNAYYNFSSIESQEDVCTFNNFSYMYFLLIILVRCGNTPPPILNTG